MLKFIPSIVFAGLLASLVVATGQANAAIAPLSPAELKEQAEEIFTGKVLSIQEKDGQSTRFDDDTKFIDRTFTITIGVTEVLKSKSVVVASEVTVQAWQPLGNKQSSVIGFVGPQGHVPIPAKGDSVTVYTAKRDLNSGGKSPVYVPLLPNGIVIQKSQPKVSGAPARTTHDSHVGDSAEQTKMLQALSNASSFQFMATIALYREMLLNSWDEKTYRQFAYYHGVNQAALTDMAKTHENDKIWGPWFKEKLASQKSIYESLKPYIAKKRNGESMSPQAIAELTQIMRQATAKLGR